MRISPKQKHERPSSIINTLLQLVFIYHTEEFIYHTEELQEDYGF